MLQCKCQPLDAFSGVHAFVWFLSLNHFLLTYHLHFMLFLSSGSSQRRFLKVGWLALECYVLSVEIITNRKRTMTLVRIGKRNTSTCHNFYDIVLKRWMVNFKYQVDNSSSSNFRCLMQGHHSNWFISLKFSAVRVWNFTFYNWFCWGNLVRYFTGFYADSRKTQVS